MKRLLPVLMGLICAIVFLSATASAADLPKRDAPRDLQWGVEYDRKGNVTDPDCPGTMSFRSSEWGQGQSHFLSLYRKTERGDIPVREIHLSMWDIVSTENLFTSESGLPSGTYYFTVYALGDGANTVDSTVAISPEWPYVRPDTTLEATNLQWGEHFELLWDNNCGDPSLADSYRIKLYHSQTPNPGDAVYLDPGYMMTYASGDSYSEHLDAISQHGPGYYFFSVQLDSNDITKAVNGPASPLSPPLYCDEEAVRLAKVAYPLHYYANYPYYFSAERVYNSLKAISQDLTDLLHRSPDSPWLSSLMKQTESNMGLTFEMETTHDTLDASQWDITGAGLPAQRLDTTLRLIVDNDSDNLVDTAPFHAAVPFTLRMQTYKNYRWNTITTDGEALPFPYKITMPLPETIDPTHAAVLQYSADGTTHTAARSRTYSEGGQWYIDFLPTQFGTFALVDGRPVLTAKTDTSLTLSMYPPADTTALCAAYDANGKMLGITGIENGRGTMHCKTDAIRALRCFLIDSESHPLREVISLPFN